MASANLTLFNQIAEAVGGTGGHTYNIDALNEIATELIGSAQDFTYNIDALNAIAESLSGEAQSFTLNIDALNFIAEAAGGDPELDTLTVDALTEWLDTGGGGVDRLPAPTNPTAEDNGDGTFAYSFDAIASRTNLIADSEDMTAGSWGITANVARTVDSLDFASNGYFYTSYDHGSAMTGLTFTFSFYLYSPTKATILMRLAFGGEGATYLVNLTAGLTRYSVSHTVVGAASTVEIGLENRSGIGAADGIAGMVYASDAQFEIAASPTSYIPTSGGPASVPSRYEYQLNGGTVTSLLLVTSGNITDAGYIVGDNTWRVRGYDAPAGVAGTWSSTVTFERAVPAGARLTEDGGVRVSEDGTTRIIE